MSVRTPQPPFSCSDTVIVHDTAARRALMSMVGLGSVSRAILTAADVPVAVIRKDMELGSANTVGSDTLMSQQGCWLGKVGS